MNEPELTRVRDAQVRVFDQAPGTDDASDMYVLEVLGVTAIVRLVTQEDGTVRPKVVIETVDYPLDAEVCGSESVYGDA